ncbi:PHP domain-containing protein, partial [Pectobacterium aquaticum]|uniref:PHP domain-containing protein n=1 Tax=Pectobacterium aquaticum TaxID=2204145 RepID=UPI000E2268B6
MKIDTHVHLLISKKQIEGDFTSINAMLDVAKISDITAICVTEHIEAIGYDKLMTDLFVDNKLQGIVFHDHVLTKQGIRLYPGAEIQLDNGTNIGVHTKLDTLLKLNHKEGAYNLPRLDQALRERKCWYKLVAHHIFWPNKTYPDYDELARYIDAIEIPAKDLENSGKYISLAGKYNLPTTGGSDAHTFIQIGAQGGIPLYL